MYIGATLQQVQGAVQRGLMRFASLRNSGLVDVRGAGTKRLTYEMAKHVARQWWNAGPGTRIVVGWIHSDGIRYTRDRHSTQESGVLTTAFKLKLVSVVRPRTETLTRKRLRTRTNHVWKHTDYDDHPRSNRVWTHKSQDTRLVLSAFYYAVTRGIKKQDRKIVKILSSPGELVAPEFFRDDYGWYNFAPLFVWPAGIIENDRVSNATNKIQDIVHRQQLVNYDRWYNNRKRNVDRRARAIKTIKAVRAKVRATRTTHARLMNELRSVPAAALHPLFPGGTDYRASIKKLKAMHTK